MHRVTMVKVFTETKAWERQAIGEAITAWLKERPELEIVDKVITQSSDAAYHCLSITLFMGKRRADWEA